MMQYLNAVYGSMLTKIFSKPPNLKFNISIPVLFSVQLFAVLNVSNTPFAENRRIKAVFKH